MGLSCGWRASLRSSCTWSVRILHERHRRLLLGVDWRRPTLRRCHSLIHGLMTRRSLHRGSLYWWWSDSMLLSASGRSMCGWTNGGRLHWLLLLLDYLGWVKCGQATAHASWRLGTSRRKRSWHGRSQIWKRGTLWSLTIRVLQCWPSRSSWSYRSWSQAHCCRGWTRLRSLPLRCACLGGRLLLLRSSRGRRSGIHLALSQRFSSLGRLVVAVVRMQAAIEICGRSWLKHVAAAAYRLRLVLTHLSGWIILSHVIPKILGCLVLHHRSSWPGRRLLSRVLRHSRLPLLSLRVWSLLHHITGRWCTLVHAWSSWPHLLLLVGYSRSSCRSSSWVLRPSLLRWSALILSLCRLP